VPKRHPARICVLALVALGLGACTSAPVPMAAPSASGPPALAAAATGGPVAAPGAGGSSRPPASVPRTAVLGQSAAPAPAPSGPAPLVFSGTTRLSDPVSPDGVPFLPASPASEPAAPGAPGIAGVPAPSVPDLSALLVPTPEPEPTPEAAALSVPLGIYAAGGYNGTTTDYTAAMEMRGDGTYSMQPGSGAAIPDPSIGQAGTYRVLNGSALEFLTGPYAGTKATLIPDYQATGRDYIDLTVDGVFTSYHFDHA
jgi:hypothetical protein